MKEDVVKSKKTIERDKFIDYSRFFHPRKWSKEDFTLYLLSIFIGLIIIVSIVNIILFGLGNPSTNQSAFGRTINGEYGIAPKTTENGVLEPTTNSTWYYIAWILLFMAFVASISQFISNIFMTKFSKRFIYFNQVSMGLWLIIDIIYGAWWIAITQIIGLVLAQIRYVQWSEQDVKEAESGEDPYLPRWDNKWTLITIVTLGVFFLAGLFLITPVIFSKDTTLYGFADSSMDLGSNQFETSSGAWGVTYYETVNSGLIYDSKPWFDLSAGIFQVAGLIIITRKSWLAWLSWEIAEIGMIVVFVNSGNYILVTQNVLLFVSNLLPLYFWFVMNQKSLKRKRANIPYNPN